MSNYYAAKCVIVADFINFTLRQIYLEDSILQILVPVAVLLLSAVTLQHSGSSLNS
jgi:hypothetical protein